MADIQYLNYGNQQVEQQAFLTKSANEVNNYVNSQPWSKKRKEKFMSAYLDIMKNGIKGASNETGEWKINTNENNIDINSMSKSDQDIYKGAAYFIKTQLESLATDKVEEEQQKKKSSLKFDNKTFQNDLRKHISNSSFLGGQEFNIGGENDRWNYLDERGENGIRGRKNRIDKLTEFLKSYSDSLTEDKYNFEDSPFKDLNDFKTRINNVITELNNGNIDALNSIGLNPKDWLNDGSGDTATTDENGNPISFGQLAESKLESDKQKALQQQIEAEAKAKANVGVLNKISGIHSFEARTQPKAYEEYLSKYGVGKQGFNQVNQVIQQLLDKGYSAGLTGNEKKQLGNLLYYIRANNPNYQGLGWGQNTNITDQEWNELFGQHSDFVGDNNKNNFIRLPWQTSDGRYTFADNKGNIYFLKPSNQQKFAAPIVNRNQKYRDYLNNFLSGSKAGINKAQQEYLKSTGFNDADIAELSGIALDIASIVDPEPISAGAMGLAAAGARNYARAQDPKPWELSDYLWQGADYLTGVIGAVPILGDAALASKVVKNVAKWGKRALTLPAVYDMLSHTPGALSAVKKAIGGESLTVEDWRNLGSFIRGLTGTRNVAVQNRAARRVMEKKGYDLSGQNSWIKRSGLWDTSIPKSQTTLKVNIKGKQQEIAISAESKTKLDKELNKAGNNQEAKDKAIRSVKEIDDRVKSGQLKSEDIKAVESSSVRNARIGKYVGVFPKFVRTTKSNYGSKEISKPTKEDTFEEYLSGNRGLWDKYKYGSNKTLRGMEGLLGLSSKPSIKSLKQLTNKKEDQKLLPLLENPGKSVKYSSFENQREIFNAWDTYGVAPKRPKKEGSFGGYGGNDKLIPNKNIGLTIKNNSGEDIPISFEKDASGKIKVSVGNNTKQFENKNINEARQYMAKQLFNISKKVDWSQIAAALRTYKKHGILKSGGRIKFTINN